MLNDFYRAILPEAGHLCLFLLPERRHVWADSIDGLLALTEKYTDRQGVYFAVESFEEPTTRTQANVLALKSFRLDIDAGEKKHAKDPDNTYPTQRDALAELVGFIRATKLAPSYIVSSGEGLHVYYCLSDAVGPDAWLPVAKGLAELAKQHGLRVDPTVTCDTARILRPLGTPHPNGSRVTALRGDGRLYGLHAIRDACPSEPLAPTRKYDTSINDDAISTFEGPPSSALKISEHCGALKQVVDKLGDVQEPLWRAMLGLVKHTVEGDEQAHDWSVGYDDYDERATQRKLDAWATGPTTCAEFSKHSSACMSCQHQGKVKSPIMLGRMTIEQIEELPPEQQEVLMAPVPQTTGMPWDGCIPQGFEVVQIKDQEVLVHHMITEVESETGEKVPIKVRVPISFEIFWFSYWADAEASTMAQVTVCKWDAMTKMVKRYDLPLAILASRADMAKALSGIGIQISTDKRALTAMEAYGKMQYQRIKDMARRARITDRFGLRVMPDGKLASLHGRYLIKDDGTIEEAMVGPMLQGACDWFKIPLPASNGEWDASVWDQITPKAKQHAKFMRDHYGHPGMEKYQLAFMLGLASPLMAFVTGTYLSGSTLPPNGVTVSLYEREGGKGKTTLMQATMLAFGNPEDLTRDQNRQGSTDLGRVAKLSVLGTMPASFDEMGRMGEKSSADLISMVANGASRERSNKDGGLSQGTKWALICLAATNRSQRDMITVAEEESSAVQYRLLELDVNNSPDFNRDQRAEFGKDWAALKPCAGALGAVIQRAIVSMSPEAVNELVMRCVNKAADMTEADKEDRFQYRALGAMLALQVLLKRLDLEMFDTKTLLETFKVANESAKSYIEENTLPSDGLQLLNRALHALRPFTIVTEDEGWIRGKVRKPAKVVGQIPPRVEARYVSDEGSLYVSAQALREWCKDHRVRHAEVVGAARKANVLRPMYQSRVREDGKFPAVNEVNLYKGMAESTNTRVQCYLFSMRALAAAMGPNIDEVFETEGDNVVTLRQPDENAA